MADPYDFENLSPIEFEALCIDLLSAELGVKFERFSPGADGGMDGRHSSAAGVRILQAKHYKNSKWSDLKSAAKRERKNVAALAPKEYYLHTSQPLTPDRKDVLIAQIDHASAQTANIWGRAELNDRLREHSKVEKRHIKLWLSSTAVLERIVHNDIAVFTEATEEAVARILRVYVENPSLASAAKILEDRHCLIVSGPPGVGKTTLAQVIAAEYCDEEWELVAITDISDALATFKSDEKQVFIFDDFLGKIRLDQASLAKSEGRISRFIASVAKHENKRFIMTTRSYVFQAAKEISEVLDSDEVDLSELMLDLSVYTREIRAKILYNHLYFSDLPQSAIDAVVGSGCVKKIIDHPNYMPRIVEWMTDQAKIEHVESGDYPTYFIATLDNPDKIWEKAFRQHITKNAQILLFSMYFMERVGFPNPGVPLKRLEIMFTNIISLRNVDEVVLSSSRMFEETLREIKSSFVVVDGSKVNFVNPSVLDFLAKEVVDVDVLLMVSSGAAQLDEIRRIWKVAKSALPEDTLLTRRVASALQKSITDSKLEGSMSFPDGFGLFGELLLGSENLDFFEFLRNGAFESYVWFNEADLIPAIEALEEGEFSKLPHARGLARICRTRLYKYLLEYEYILDLEEAADLAEKVAESFVEFPKEFIDVLKNAIEEAVDALDIHRFDRGEDPESLLGGWLEQIEKVEMCSNSLSVSSKKDDIEDLLVGFEIQRESQEEDYRERTRFRGSSFGSGGSRSKSLGFSDDDVASLFSSLSSGKG